MKKINLIIGFILFIILILVLPIKIIENFENNIILNNWWSTEDIKSKNIFSDLFKHVKYDEINIYSVFGDKIEKENNKLYIQFSGESHYRNPDLFDINFIPTDLKLNNIIIFPYAYFHILHTKMDIKKFVNKRIYNNKNNFCLFAVSNGGCKTRNDFFEKLNKYKKVDSCGKFMNNMNEGCPDDHNSKNYFDFISNYKFMICFENTSKPNYLTEKLINAYYNGTIPIYWGCSNIEDYVNMDSILYLKPNYTENDVKNLINKIIYLDNNEDAYKKMYEETFFKNGVIPEEFNIDKIREKVYRILENK